ncbi:hypothetical protein B0H14DRAFT_2389056, partial [Mycena olivaceomarginata]
QKFKRSILPSDLRMLFYAAFVKSFIQDGRHSAQWDVYAALSLVLPAYPLFPNLRHLTWRTPDHVLPFLRMLAGTKLRSKAPDLWSSEVVRSALLP